MKVFLPLLLSICFLSPAWAAELTNAYKEGTYNTLVPNETNQPTGYGEYTAVSETDPTDLVTYIGERVAAGGSSPDIVIASSSTTIPSTAEGNTYVHTGSSNITYTLPPASGGSAVDNGWEVVVANRGAGDLTIDGAGADTINSAATLVITDLGRAVRLQKVANSAWITIADTKDETGTGGGSGITADERARLLPTFPAAGSRDNKVPKFNGNTLGWETDAEGAGGAIADNSIAPAKAQAGTAAQKKSWRERLASSSIGQVSAALPATTNYNAGDLLIIARGGTTTVTFVDLDAPSTQLTTTVAGDLMMVLSNRWTRVGNLYSGGIAAAANKAVIDRLTVFETAELTPGGLPNNVWPEFIALRLDGKIRAEQIAQIQVVVDGSIVVATVNDAAAIRPFNTATTVNSRAVGVGGIINLSLVESTRDNLQVNLGTAAQYVRFDIRYKFAGTSLSGSVEPDVIDHVHFGYNNNSYRAPAATADLRTQVSQIATPASGDRFFFTDENQAGDPLRYAQLASILNRTFTQKAAVAGATNIHTVTLDAADTEIFVRIPIDNNGDEDDGISTGTIPRALLTSTAQQWVFDHRNPNLASGGGRSRIPDGQSIGTAISISGNTLTFNSTGWGNAGQTPVVYSK